MQIYKVVVGESVGLARDSWLVQAKSLLTAVKKAEDKRSRSKGLYKGWVITSVTELGELEEVVGHTDREVKVKVRRVLDLFCGAGGAAMGMHRAWPDAEITGVDINHQPRYPFKLIVGDVMKQRLVAEDFDFIWASPPCQHYTQMLNHGRTPRSNHADLIQGTRDILLKSGLPYVIENVAGAPLQNAVMLCGTMFGLKTLRHRFFECEFPVNPPVHFKHNGKGIRNQRDGGTYYRCYGHETGKREWGKAMGINWMKTPELAQAIPPAYSQYIAEQFDKFKTSTDEPLGRDPQQASLKETEL